MAGFLTAAAGSSAVGAIAGSVVRLAIAYGIARLINGNTQKNNNFGRAQTRVDEGVRVQLPPNTTNTIPLLFGSAFFGGSITDAQLTDQNRTLWTCITLSDVVGQTVSGQPVTTRFTDVYWNNQRVFFKPDGVTVDYVINDDGVVDASSRDLVKIYLYSNGSATPVPLTDPETNAPIPAAFSGVDARTLMPGWTNDHRMSNLTFALVRLSYNRDKGITGLPDIKFNVRNDNYRPGDAIYSYLKNARVGGNLADSEIDIASLIALNDYADDEVAYLDADGTFKTLGDRYQINGLVDTGETILSNLERLTAASGCYLNYDIAAGKWGVIINRDSAPVLHFDDSNIISGISVTGTALDTIYNGIEIEFPHRQIRDQSDFARIDLPSEFRNANEPDNTIRVKYDLLNEPLQARILGYNELYQNRMDQVATFTTDYSKINTEAGDVITITNSVYAWNQKQFRVVRVKEVETDEGGIAVEITAQEYDSTMYTAGGMPRRPGVPSEPIGIPSLGAIATPAAPTVLQTNNQNAQPNIILRSVVPGSTQAGTSVIVDRMEFWYAEGTLADNVPIANYRLIETSTNANGNPFTTGSNQDSQPIITLGAGNYLFRVRAGNPSFYSEYSQPAALVWNPVQRPDEVDEGVIFRPRDSNLLSLLGPLALGAIAYFAYSALRPQVTSALSNTALGNLLGITNPQEIEQAREQLEESASAFRIVNAGGNELTSATNNSVTFEAGEGIEITASSVDNVITISLVGGGDPPPPPPPPGPSEGNLNVNFGAGAEDIALDNCQIITLAPQRPVTTPSTVARVYAIAPATETVRCYDPNSMSSVIANRISVRNGSVVSRQSHGFGNGNPRPWIHNADRFDLYLDTNLKPEFAQFNGKVIFRKVVSADELILYCNFDDNGNTLPVEDYCSLDPDSRPTFSTIEFPAGHRFVTYQMLQNWLITDPGIGVRLGAATTTTASQSLERRPFYVRRNRICRNINGTEPSYDFNTI